VTGAWSPRATSGAEAVELGVEVTRLKGEIARLKERLAQSEGTISELSDFRGRALARLAAQHAEITRLRQEARLAASIRRLPVPSPEEQNLS
jgi:predicted  nucleic acid-binding Zn-ribbon protein